MKSVRRLVAVTAALIVLGGVISAAPAEAATNPLPTGGYNVTLTGTDCGLYSVNGSVLAVNGNKATLKVVLYNGKKLSLAGSAARKGKAFTVNVKHGRTMTALFTGTRAAGGRLGARVETGGVNPGGETGWYCATKATLKAIPKKVTAGTPTITGTAKVGKTLTAKHGSWKPTGLKFSYQWLRDKDPIAKATKSSYKIVKADAGSKISVTVTAKKTGYAVTSKTSKAKTVPAAKGPVAKTTQIVIADSGIVAKDVNGKPIGSPAQITSTHAVAKLLTAALGKPNSYRSNTGSSPWGTAPKCTTEVWRWFGPSGTESDGIYLEYESANCYFGYGTLVVSTAQLKGVSFAAKGGVAVGTPYADVQAKGWKGQSCDETFASVSPQFFYAKPDGKWVTVIGNTTLGVQHIYDRPQWQDTPCHM